MKRFLSIFFVFIFIPFFNAWGQMATFDSALNALIAATGIDQMIYYGQQLADNIQQIAQFQIMIENFTTQAQRAVQNLASAKDIKSWDDFMGWYNRQLYLERKTAETFDNMNVTIGKKQYRLTDIEGMAYGFNDTYVNYWNKEFTEEQQREMWLGLGLTPANYAYVQPFRAKARELTKEGLTAVSIQNEWYMRNMQKNNERQKKLAEDQLKSTENKMGSKEITMMILESLLETNKVMNDIAMEQAKQRELKAVEDSLNNPPDKKPPISNWERNGFEPLRKK